MAKKILIFSTAYLPLIGGAEIAIKELTDRLVGFDFDLITARLKTDLAKQEKIGRVTIYRVGLGNKLDKFLLPILGLAKAFALNKKNNYRIIWSLMASQASIAAAFLKITFSDKKLILNLQEGDDEEYLKRYVFNSDLLYKVLIRPWHLLVFKKADYITAISADLKNRAEKNGVKATIEIIPNGVDLEKFKREDLKFKVEQLKNKLNFSENDKIIITVSRLVKKNGLGDLIEAMSYLPANVKLLIIGGGELEADLKSKILNLKLDNRVIMLGAVNNEIVYEYLAMADIFVRPSLSEGQGIAFLEAMAVGLPVIATPVGGIVDFLRDNETGLFCEVKNPKSIADKIKILLEDKEKAGKIAIIAKAMVEKRYNWDLIAKNMENVFDKNNGFGNDKMKILIVTGVYPPDIGGPAQYAKNLVEQFTGMGHEVKVLNYKLEKKLPIGLRHVLYFFRVIFNLNKVNFIVALDTFSVGMPAVIAAMIFNRKIIIRTGGDFLWESYVERSGNLITLRQFYEIKPGLSLKEKIIFILSKYILKNSTAIIFSTAWQKEIFEKYYNLSTKKSYIIENYFEVKKLGGEETGDKKFLWAGRPIKLKNIERLRQAFSKAQKIEPELKLKVIQNMSYEKLLEEMKKSYAMILPSLSEVSPNFILDAISCRKPFIMTKESGYYETLKSIGLFIDPLDEDDIKNKILFLADDKNYLEYKNKIINFNYKHTWNEIAGEFINIYKKL
jgi:glycosyltransferase involved in cell wall biosynthesis